jgi:hypothetical protein
MVNSALSALQLAAAGGDVGDVGASTRPTRSLQPMTTMLVANIVTRTTTRVRIVLSASSQTGGSAAPVALC